MERADENMRTPFNITKRKRAEKSAKSDNKSSRKRMQPIIGKRQGGRRVLKQCCIEDSGEIVQTKERVRRVRTTASGVEAN